MKTVILNIIGALFPFVIEDVINYSLGRDNSVFVTITQDVWQSMYLDATIDYYAEELPNKLIKVKFLNVQEYDIILP